MERLLTLQETQEYLAVSSSKIYELVNSKDFPSLKIGKQWRIEPNRLDSWINMKMQERDDNCLM